jgi:hypothetical protein
VESAFGDGRTPPLSRPPAGRRGHDQCLPGFQHIPQDWVQDFDRYREHGLEALSDRSRRPVRYTNQQPSQIETLIVRLKGEKPHWVHEISASCWSDGSTAISAFRPRVPSTRFSTVTTWSSAAVGRATAREVDDGIWLVSFMHCDLGYFDLEQKTLQPLDNPFGTRLSPMS